MVDLQTWTTAYTGDELTSITWTCTPNFMLPAFEDEITAGEIVYTAMRLQPGQEKGCKVRHARLGGLS